ncbi:MAG TPA: helix-turn-helix transcriptional regulator [Thermoanaerobaculia bacterium]|nr:helix-turn-helix transcriptional regulator [Thermoanaerobaculia bacterium]
MARKIPSLLGLALTGLLKANGWTAKELAGKAGVSQSTMSVYESGDLTRERLEELAALMELGPEEVERAVFAASLLLPPPPLRTPVDPTGEEWRVIQRAAAMAGRDVADRVRDDLLREVREEKAALALREGEELYERLKPYSDSARRDLIENAVDYQHWGLAVHLCHRSEKAAADKPPVALGLAGLAVFVARHVSEIDGWRHRLEGWSTAFLANAQKVANDVPLAGATFTDALRLWDKGKDEAGLLSEARLLDLGASVRREQDLFPQALELHADALAVARPEEVGHLLLSKACTHQDHGAHNEALLTLEKAAQHIDGERQPRLLFGLRFNQAANLILLGRAAEAGPIVDAVRLLAEELRNDLDLIKTVWLRANADASLGKRREALDTLIQVRRDFDARNLPYDYALASLDAALLYREEGRFGEIRVLAKEILEIFRAQEVHREAIASMILFQEAAEKERVSDALVRRLQNYLSRARSNPKLRFEALNRGGGEPVPSPAKPRRA